MDVSNYPTIEQSAEAHNKRRTGLGVTGLGNALQQLCIPYGSEDAISYASQIMQEIAEQAYLASIELAKERGSFPAFDKKKYLESPFIQSLPKKVRDGISKYGIRNGVLLTIAPTGTTSLYYNNISSGCEPSFSWRYKRKVRQADDSWKEFVVEDYGYRLYKKVHGNGRTDEEILATLPDYMVTALELPVKAHIDMQAICQKYVDASISKTVNCPENMSYEDFKEVYTYAYDTGCKGCTTYRPSPIRGSILSTLDEKEDKEQLLVAPRPEVLTGCTYKRKWPGTDHSFYVTINDRVDEYGIHYPHEIFINSKNPNHQEWMTALTRMISAIFRKGGDLQFIVEELMQVYSFNPGYFIKKKYYPSMAALIAQVIEEHFISIGLIKPESEETSNEEVLPLSAEVKYDICPQCNAPTLTKQEGCTKCLSCGYSNCG